MLVNLVILYWNKYSIAYKGSTGTFTTVSGKNAWLTWAKSSTVGQNFKYHINSLNRSSYPVSAFNLNRVDSSGLFNTNGLFSLSYLPEGGGSSNYREIGATRTGLVGPDPTHAKYIMFYTGSNAYFRYWANNTNNVRIGIPNGSYTSSSCLGTVYQFLSSSVRGNYIELVSSTVNNTYPNNGISGSYWYTMVN